MKFVTAEDMRAGEGSAILREPALDRGMMDRAGKGLAAVIGEMARHRNRGDCAICLLAGPGNNGGDAFAAAMHLLGMGFAPEVWLACPVEKLKGAARYFFEKMGAGPVPLRVLADEADWDRMDDGVTPQILVDALLGTGTKGVPKGTVGRAIEYLSARSGDCWIVSADLPSGMDADTGQAAGAVVRADVTVTMGYPKAGMACSAAQEALGSLVSVPIGLPAEYADPIPDARPGLQWISREDVQRILPRRRRDAHKGDFGRTLLLGGSERYPGAIVLAAAGALRSGAGLVQVECSAAAAVAVAAREPEAIVRSGLNPDIPVAGADSILAGPGLGRDPEARRLVARLLREAPCPLVLDADAIAVLEGKPEVVKNCPQPVILTPHPGELAQLLGTDVAGIQKDRLAAAEEAAERTGAVVVLKGAGTLVAKAGQAAWINLNGNPGMACGGSGDVLAGLVSGLLAQRIVPIEAACAAVWLHGTAGDLAAWRHTQAAMKAGDIAEALPAAFGWAGPR